MKRIVCLITLILLLIPPGFCLADRVLDGSEIRQIFQKVTANPRETWIPSGTINATHQSCDFLNGYVKESDVVLKYDGNRFYWEIDVQYYSKDLQPIIRVGLTKRKKMDLKWNRKRIFAWDGSKYTMYFKSGNHAIVSERPEDAPGLVGEPLSTGIIPWGHGIFTYNTLTSHEYSGTEQTVGGKTQILITLQVSKAMEMKFIFAPEKDYALLYFQVCGENNAGRSSVTRTYEDHILISGKWVPTKITIEQHDEKSQPRELLTYDHWVFNSINPEVPDINSFKVGYDKDALIEYHSTVTGDSLLYRHRERAEGEFLLQNRLAIIANQSAEQKNCATIAMKFVAERLGKNTEESSLATLVTGPKKSTSLYVLKEYAEGLDLHCRAVRTNIDTLKTLEDCQAILYLPRVKHYIVLSHIDDSKVWSIDLDSNKFYYNTKIENFGKSWGGGIALLVSEEPIDVIGSMVELEEAELRQITGSQEGGVTNYSCTKLIQDYGIDFCTEPLGIYCMGQYRSYVVRYGCEEDENGGECLGSPMVGCYEMPCIIDPYYFDSCNTDPFGSPTEGRAIRACR